MEKPYLTRNKFLLFSQNYISHRKSDFRKAGNIIIILVALYKFPTCFFDRVHIDERLKIKEDERTQAFEKVHSDIVEIFFHICNPLYENRSYDAK